MQHTPGPWRIGDHKPYVEVWGPMRMNNYPILASMESEPREANAILMAAAPDMLALLKRIAESYRGYIPDFVEAVYSVIDKAEGRQLAK